MENARFDRFSAMLEMEALKSRKERLALENEIARLEQEKEGAFSGGGLTSRATESLCVKLDRIEQQQGELKREVRQVQKLLRQALHSLGRLPASETEDDGSDRITQ
jgi:hypothetical protein